MLSDDPADVVKDFINRGRAAQAAADAIVPRRSPSIDGGMFPTDYHDRWRGTDGECDGVVAFPEQADADALAKVLRRRGRRVKVMQRHVSADSVRIGLWLVVSRRTDGR